MLRRKARLLRILITKCRPRPILSSVQSLLRGASGHSSNCGRMYSTAPSPIMTVKEKIERVTEGDRPVDQRIYFLGMGAVGKLIAYSFTDIPEPPPITLIFPSAARRSEFLDNDSALEYRRNGVTDIHRGYEAEFTIMGLSGEDTRPLIDNLVVATKAPFTANALSAVKHRLGPESTIVLLQNGMGLVEELKEHVFPDVETRPHFILGSVTHGAINTKPFVVDHTAIGNIALTALPKVSFQGESDLESPVTLLAPSTRHLLRTFTRTPLLGGIALAPRDFMLIQLEKLAGNCVINPLTAILGCPNGEIAKTSAARLMRLLLAEISLVIRSMPELQDIPGIENRFSPAKLEHNVMRLIKSTANNTSSMLQDVAKGQKTEIDYLNGYIFRRGEELGIRSMVNFTIKCLVSTRSLMARETVENYVAQADNTADLDKIP